MIWVFINRKLIKITINVFHKNNITECIKNEYLTNYGYNQENYLIWYSI